MALVSKIELSGMRTRYLIYKTGKAANTRPKSTSEPIRNFVSFEHERKLTEVFGVPPFDPTIKKPS